MKKYFLVIIGAVFFFAGAYSSDAFARTASVIVVVSGTPCSGGPTDCVRIASVGEFTYWEMSQGPRTARRQVIQFGGYTRLLLNEGRYVFAYRNSLGRDTIIQQDIVPMAAGGQNFVNLLFDTGIR